MNFKLLKQIIEKFELFSETYDPSQVELDDFISWLKLSNNSADKKLSLTWEGKEEGRSVESMINTLIIHMNRYARGYSRAILSNSRFSSQDDFIFLISLNALGPMSKMDLIRKNVHEKSGGMQIINRLINNGWVDQQDALTDRREKWIAISEKGQLELAAQMPTIRKVTSIVTADLEEQEKLALLELLQKLNHFHEPIYEKNLPIEDLLDHADQLRKASTLKN